MGTPGSPYDPGPGTASSASETTRSSTPLRRGGLQGVRARVAQLLSTARVAWVWGVHGLLGVLLGLLLLRQFGATLGPTRAILGVWVLVTAGATAWRWLLDGRRSLSLLIASVIGLVAGALVLVGGGLSLLLIMWAIGFFWIAVGLLELLAWFQSRGSAIQWPWISGLILFVGVGHANAAIQAAPHYIGWLAAIVDGKPPVSDCGKPLPVRPAQPTTA